MIKKKVVHSLIYFGIVFIIGMIITRNEYISTALIISFWFSIPMALAYFIELLCCKKVTKAVHALIALANSIFFIILCVILSKLLYIPF